MKDLYNLLESFLVRQSGKAVFPNLFTLDGHLVAAKLITTHTGTMWAILANDNPQSTIVGWFNESRARNPSIARRHNARKGYYVGRVLTCATVGYIGLTPSTRQPTIVRADGGFSRAVDIIDNGQEKGSIAEECTSSVIGG